MPSMGGFGTTGAHMSNQSQIYLTPDQVEAEYRLSRRWLIRQRAGRHGPAYVKAGRRVLYRRSDVEAYLASVTVSTEVR